METRNYAVMLLFVFAIVDVYSYSGETDAQPGSSTVQHLQHADQGDIIDDGLAGESRQQYVHGDGLRRSRRNQNDQPITKTKKKAAAPAPESAAARTARIAAEREQERRSLVQQFQGSIQSYMTQGYKRPVAIDLTIQDNREKAKRIIELSVYPYD